MTSFISTPGGKLRYHKGKKKSPNRDIGEIFQKKVHPIKKSIKRLEKINLAKTNTGCRTSQVDLRANLGLAQSV
jgi:ribosomal protein L34E